MKGDEAGESFKINVKDILGHFAASRVSLPSCQRSRKSDSNVKVNKAKVTAVLQLKLEESDWWRYALRWDPSPGQIAPPSGKDTEDPHL